LQKSKENICEKKFVFKAKNEAEGEIIAKVCHTFKNIKNEVGKSLISLSLSLSPLAAAEFKDGNKIK
jgi:hypothetical protein